MSDTRVNIAVAQMDCVIGETEPNLNKIRYFTELAAKLGAELVIFPECATTGYFIGEKMSKLAEPSDGPTAKTLGEIAKQNKIHLACGMYTAQGNGICNSQLLFSPAGKCLAVYDKAHLFSKERELYKAGNKPVVVETGIGKIGMTICYDLIFPDYVRRLVELGADFIINSTNWINDPYQREVWGWTGERVRGLASTRALENVTIMAMSCRVGHEVAAPGVEFDSFGHSTIASPSGKILASMTEGEGVAFAKIDIPAADIQRWRSIATYRMDRRPELYR
jgi:predicted amidohydrolase